MAEKPASVTYVEKTEDVPSASFASNDEEAPSPPDQEQDWTREEERALVCATLSDFSVLIPRRLDIMSF